MCRYKTITENELAYKRTAKKKSAYELYLQHIVFRLEDLIETTINAHHLSTPLL